jgi:GTP-binding protein EngB required for normal cell division
MILHLNRNYFILYSKYDILIHVIFAKCDKENRDDDKKNVKMRGMKRYDADHVSFLTFTLLVLAALGVVFVCGVNNCGF